MARKSKRILSRLTSEAVKGNVPRVQISQMTLFPEEVKKVVPISLPPDKETATDKVFRLIYENSICGYCFTDQYSGIPWIQHKDIEDRGDGIFVIRFRCPPSYIHEVHFWSMANRVLKVLNSAPMFFHETKEEYGIPYEDCVWVIQEGDNENDMSGDIPSGTENHREEKLDEFEEALSNFV